MAERKIIYSEPIDYFPKEIREKYWGKEEKETKTKKSTKSKGGKKKSN